MKLLWFFLLLGTGTAHAITPQINATVQGNQVVARTLQGQELWRVPLPRFNGRVGVQTYRINNWIPSAVIIGGTDELGYSWFTLLNRKTGTTQWQTRGQPLQYAGGMLLVQPEIPSGYFNRWKLQRFNVQTGRGELFMLRYDQPRAGCGSMRRSGMGDTSYAFPLTCNPRKLVINAADECSELELTFDWLGNANQRPQVRALPCLNDALQSVPCPRQPR